MDTTMAWIPHPDDSTIRVIRWILDVDRNSCTSSDFPPSNTTASKIEQTVTAIVAHTRMKGSYVNMTFLSESGLALEVTLNQ